MASEEAVQKIVESMVTLNQKASEKMRALGAHACTDITGFGFIGHALEMVQASHAGMMIQAEKVPMFPEALDYAKMGLIPAGAYTNRQFFSCSVDLDPRVSPALVDILYDPQTSGGLFISLPSEKAEKFVSDLKEEEKIDSSIVGEVVEEPRGRIRIL